MNKETYAPLLSSRCAVALAVGVALLTAGSSNAATIFDNGTLNIVTGPSDPITVADSLAGASTTVSLQAGADVTADGDGQSVGLTGQSVLLFADGSVSGNIDVQDSSVAFLLGGATVGGDVIASGTGNLQLSAAARVAGEVAVEDDAVASFFGGEVDTFGAFGNAVATINGGSIDDDLDVGDDAVVNVIDVFVNDDVDAEGNGVFNLQGGVFDEDVEATDSSTINISGGQFVQIFSEGANLVASGGTINATGGVFGTAGVAGDGELQASSGGVVNLSGVEIAGAADGTASPVTVSASINGVVNLDDVAFGDLSISAVTGAELDLQDISADELVVDLVAGSVTIDITEAESLSLTANIDSEVEIRGGLFGSGDINSLTGSTIEILGSDFVLNGVLDALEIFPSGEILFGSGDVSGFLADGSPFEFTFSRGFSPGTTIRLVVVPEPGTMTVVLATLLGGMGAHRRRV